MAISELLRLNENMIRFRANQQDQDGKPHVDPNRDATRKSNEELRPQGHRVIIPGSTTPPDRRATEKANEKTIRTP